MMQGLLNAMRMQAALTDGGKMSTRIGIVTSYDHQNHAAKVEIQPEGIESGWLPVCSPWIGNGWGMFAPPSINDMVCVHFQEGNLDAGFIGMRFFNDIDRPLDVPSGELHFVHQSGSSLKFLSNGNVELNAAGTLRATGTDIQLHATNSYSWDVDGYGERWTALGGGSWEHKTWQTGATVISTPLSINPPEGP